VAGSGCVCGTGVVCIWGEGGSCLRIGRAEDRNVDYQMSRERDRDLFYLFPFNFHVFLFASVFG